MRGAGRVDPVFRAPLLPEVIKMAYYTPEQVAKAKEWDLLTYLQVFEPGELKNAGQTNTAPVPTIP